MNRMFGGGEDKFKLIFTGKDSGSPVSKGVTLVEKLNTQPEVSTDEKIVRVVTQYIQQIRNRDLKNTSERMKATHNKSEISRTTFRLEEAQFQNNLLRIIYQHNISIDKVALTIKRTLAQEKKDNSIEFQEQVDRILVGVMNCREAVLSLEKCMKKEYPDNETWIATNDHMDAGYKVDLLAAVENNNGLVDTLYLVQVKSSKDKEQITDIKETHAKYLNMLPQLIGPLNKKEAAKIVEHEMREVLDKERREETEEQFTLFSLVLEQYIKDLTDMKEINASSFYQKLKNEGGLFNPFTVMGILKNTKVLKTYVDLETEVEKLLALTADQIPYSEAESLAFYHKNNVNTIMNTAKIFSIVMVGGTEVSRTVLTVPYQPNNSVQK
ncbi:MAG: hypothetical protein M3Q34_01235 [bacterium]|nr:hypothetical protein [bacterium]